MSLSVPGRLPGRPVRRVRHEVRDSVAVVAFSLVASCCLVPVFTLFLALVG
jgi:hypothetical protein